MPSLLSSTLTRLSREDSIEAVNLEPWEGIPETLLAVYERYRSQGITPPPLFKGVDIEALAAEFERRSKLIKSLSPISGRSKADLEADRAREWEKCASDSIYWINTWGWTSDPRWLPGPTTLPMILFDRQVEYVLWLEDHYRKRSDGFVDKCRDMGLTWLNCFLLVHKFLFEPGFKGAVGSRKEMLVDRLGDMDCIFEKMRFILHHLPLWLAPCMINPRTVKTSMKMFNPTSGAAITGEAGDNIGRGGRNSLYFVDEAAYLERPSRVEGALSENCPSVIWVSTPNIYAPGNLFDQKVASGNHDVFTFDWWQDKRKDGEWLENRKKKLDPIVFAAEILRDRNSGLSNTVILRKWVEAAIEFPLNGTVRRAGFDIANGGNDLSVLVIGPWPRVDLIEKIEYVDPDPVRTAEIAASVCRRENVAELRYDANPGLGSGCGGAWKKMNNIGFKIYTFFPGGKTSRDNSGKPLFIEEFERTSDICYDNAKAEAWWEMRQRFYKTWLVKQGERYFPDHELVSIPRHTRLIDELCIPTWTTSLTGKVVIESKDSLKKRGVKSPDYAEALSIFLWTKNQEYEADWIDSYGLL